MKKVVLLTGHYYNSKRRAGFRFLADAFLMYGVYLFLIIKTVKTMDSLIIQNNTKKMNRFYYVKVK